MRWVYMRILILEDEPVVSNGLMKAIENFNCSWKVVGIASDAADALESFDYDNIDIILADINLPVMSGLEFVGVLRKRGYNTVVIIVSGYAEFDFARQAMKQDAIDYIVKPVSLIKLKGALENAQKLIDERKRQSLEQTFIKENLMELQKQFFYELIYETTEYTKQKIDEKEAFFSLKGRNYLLVTFHISTSLSVSSKVLEKMKHGWELTINDKTCRYKTVVFSNGLGIYTLLAVIDDAMLNIELNALKEKLKGFIQETCSEAVSGKIILCNNLNKISGNVKESLMSLREYIGSEFYFQKDNDKNYTEGIAEGLETSHYTVLIEKTIRYIKENYDKNISLSEIAEHVYVHPAYLSNLFKKETGLNLKDFINNYRIQKAKEFLEDEDSKIYLVANRVGFISQRYFSQVFRKKIGITPIEYKERCFFARLK